jgi:hypothetical protein
MTPLNRHGRLERNVSDFNQHRSTELVTLLLYMWERAKEQLALGLAGIEEVMPQLETMHVDADTVLTILCMLFLAGLFDLV